MKQTLTYVIGVWRRYRITEYPWTCTYMRLELLDMLPNGCDDFRMGSVQLLLIGLMGKEALV